MESVPLVFGGVLCIALGGCGSTTHAPSRRAAPAELVVVDARIYTGIAGAPYAEALAVRGPTIAAVGSRAEIDPYIGPQTKVITAGGRLVVPGINDGHMHPYVEVGERLVLDDPRDPQLDAVIAAVTRQAAAAKPGTWLLGKIGRSVFDRVAEVRDALDRAAPDVPVTLFGRGGHGYIWNAAALREIGITDEAPDPVGGWFDRRNGKIVMAHEYAASMGVAVRRDRASSAERIAHFAAIDRSATELGITSLQAMSRDLPVAARELASADPRARWRLIDQPMTPIFDRPPLLSSTHPRIAISGHKSHLDGSPMERDAWRTVDYVDRPGWRGRSNFTDAQLRALLDPAIEEQPVLHIVGDAMIERVLALMEELAPATYWRQRRLRFEHADYITRAQIERVRELGIVVCQNPAHLNKPPEPSLVRDTANAQLLRSVVTAGAHLCLGSDGPLNPWFGIMLAAQHPKHPAEALSVEQALIAYTQGSAYAEHAETSKGVLAPGFVADLVVLSQDIFAVPLDALPATRAVVTIVGGQPVVNASPSP